jgi:4-phospho-D-threonate 3-dehydrogenase / 4-phospho-D-erythronate 3-dehydrogenase
MPGKLKIAITMGDPAGVGPELCLRALAEPAIRSRCVPVVFGDAGVLERVADRTGLPRPTRVISLSDWRRDGHLAEPAVVDCGAVAAADVRPGRLSARCGRAAYRYIQAAIESALAHRVAGVVTAPLHKEALHLARVPYAGHTEIFSALTGARRSCMMLTSQRLTVTMVTTHVGLRDVPGKLSTRRIGDVIELTHQAMLWLKRRAPRLAVCGLNPHCGEHGLFGRREEEKMIRPAVEQARARGICVDGPVVPDVAFVPRTRQRFDAIVCQYHDQGHIPFKMLAFEHGVNITLGLPVIRTSVDHGTAFDIAWKGEASPASLQAAIRVAVRLAVGRAGKHSML